MSTTRSEGDDVGVKTGIGIVFALCDYPPAIRIIHNSDSRASVCFAVITGAFIAKRRHDTHANDTRPWLGMAFHRIFHNRI